MNAQPLASLTRIVRVLIMISVAISIFALMVRGILYYKLMTVDAEVDWGFPSEEFLRVLEVSQYAITVFTNLVFIYWIYRINKNLHALTDEPMQFTPAWSAGSFFVPIINFFRPYQVMKEIWQVSHKDASSTSALLKVWWGMWLISFFMARVSGRMMERAETADEVNRALSLFVVSDLLDAVKFVVMLLIVTQIWAAYRQNIDDEGLASDDENVYALPTSS